MRLDVESLIVNQRIIHHKILEPQRIRRAEAERIDYERMIEVQNKARSQAEARAMRRGLVGGIIGGVATVPFGPDANMVVLAAAGTGLVGMVYGERVSRGVTSIINRVSQRNARSSAV